MTPYQIHQNHADLFKIISSCLFNTNMGVQTGISCSSCELLAVLVRDVSASTGVFVSFCKSEVNDVDYVLLLTHADQEVIWFDISVQEALLVNVFNPLQHLNSQHKYGL